MTKKHFVALADAIRQQAKYTPRVLETDHTEYDKGFVNGAQSTLGNMIVRLADFCQAQNGNFNRERWLAYVAGTVGPNGGKR